MLNLLQTLVALINEGVKQDALSKGQRIPQSFKIVEKDGTIQILGPSYIQYLVHGRGPGKQPPKDAILKWVRSNPQLFGIANAAYRKAHESQLSFVIARSIGRHGTLIYQGKKPGLDIQGVVARSLKETFQKVGKGYGKDILDKLTKQK